MRDGDIRHALIATLNREHAGQRSVRVWPEMSVGLGAARVDVGLINGSISGYEIKSDRDNLARLPSQVEHYSRCLDYASIVVSGKHHGRIRNHVPAWWGILVAQVDHTGNVTLLRKRKADKNPSIDAFYVAQLLWRDEAYEILRSRDLHAGLARATRWTLWDAVAAALPLEELRAEVRRHLTARPPYQSA